MYLLKTANKKKQYLLIIIRNIDYKAFILKLISKLDYNN